MFLPLLILIFIAGGIILLISFGRFWEGIYHRKSSIALSSIIVFVLTVLIVGPCAYWNYYSYHNRQIEEVFCKVFVDNTNSDREVQYVRSGQDIFNVNKELGCIVSESSFVRVYKLNAWSCGIWYGIGKYQFEIISPGHERYTEAKNSVMNKE